VARESAAALRVADVASFARKGSFFVVISLSRGVGDARDPIVPGHRPAVPAARDRRNVNKLVTTRGSSAT
jgi:hypothetical protein